MKTASVFQTYFTEIILLGLIHTGEKTQSQLLSQGCVSMSAKPKQKERK